jgi:hypothetical protein
VPRKKLSEETPDTLARRVFAALERGEVHERGVRDLFVVNDGYKAKEWDRAREALFELVRRVEGR